MPVLIVTLLVILISAWSFLIYARKRKHFREHTLPKQLTIVNELLEELNDSRITLSVCSNSGQERPQSFTLPEIARFVEDDYRFSSELYDEYGILFSEKDRQLLLFDKYLKDPNIPADIKEELGDFYNKEFKQPLKIPASFFKLSLNQGLAGETGQALFKGSGEAFQNWLSFKESADNLVFVIHQWMDENNYTFENSELHI